MTGETLDEALAAWRLWGLASGHSERTITDRANTVRRLAADGLDPLQATTEQLTAHIAVRGQTLARSSLATYRAHLGAWSLWAQQSGRRADDPSLGVPKPKAPRGVPHPVTQEELAALFAACSDPRAKQTRAYITLAAFAGLRVHEIAKIKGTDFHGAEVRVTGKGGHTATVPLHHKIQALRETMPASGWWFPSDSPTGHVHRSSVSTAIARAIKRAGLVNTVPHALRHYFCTEVLRASGGDLRTTQLAARHASPATTAQYTLVPPATLSAAVLGIPT